MILVISPHTKVRECAGIFHQTFGEATDAADGLDHAMSRLRVQQYSAVVFDQTMVESEPDDAEMALQHLGSAVPIFINFGVSNMARVLKEVRSALERRLRDERAARENTEQSLRAELKGIVTAMLLCCELALETDGPLETRLEKIKSIHDLTLELKNRLAIS